MKKTVIVIALALITLVAPSRPVLAQASESTCNIYMQQALRAEAWYNMYSMLNDMTGGYFYTDMANWYLREAGNAWNFYNQNCQ